MNQSTEFKTNEYFPKNVKTPSLIDIKELLRFYNITEPKSIQLIDSTRDVTDIRLNYIIDKKYVLRLCNDSSITEIRLQELNRLIGRYHDTNIQCPSFISLTNGKYLQSWSSLTTYLSEYIDMPIASDVDLKYENLLTEEVANSVASFAEKYKNIDLSKTYGMYSLFDLAPLDKEAGIDEKEDNFNELIDYLRNLDQNSLADALQCKHDSIRSKLKAVYHSLPRCVFQGDENFSNILIDRNQHFYGFIDFNLAGTEVIVNQLANLAGFDYDSAQEVPLGAAARLDYAIHGYLDNVKRMFQFYHATPTEKQAMVWYAWIVMVCQWPTVCWFKRNLAKESLRDEILDLLSLIADLPEDTLYTT